MPIPGADHCARQRQPQALLARGHRFKCPMAVGDVVADDENASNPAGRVLIVDRAEAVGPPHILAFAMPGHRHELVFMPGRAFSPHDGFDLGLDDVPDFLPAFFSSLAERARVALRAHCLAIGVVVKLDEVRSPPDEHGMLGGEKNADRGAEALRPAARGAKRTGAPVKGAHQRAHFPSAAKKVPLCDGRALCCFVSPPQFILYRSMSPAG